MAAPCRARMTFRVIKQFQHCRCYSIEPPNWMGGRNKLIEEREPPELFARINLSFKDRMQDQNVPEEGDDIGVEYSLPIPSMKEKLALHRAKKTDPTLEQSARHRKLQIPLQGVRDAWYTEYGPLHTKAMAEHYGIFRDLFNNSYFHPVINLRVCYELDEEVVMPVHRGNQILPEEAKAPPIVEFDAKEDTLWTLVLTNPDGHLSDNEAEYLHWFVGNIPGDDLSKGDVVCDYLRPFPPRGTGYHRHIFILFQQTGHIDYSKITRPPQCNTLLERTFSTEEFYRQHKDNLLPMGLSFFQSEWDKSVREVYHNILNMKEPEFEFVHQQPYHPEQKMYPHKEPFDRYYDRYRDKKDLAEEVIKERLKMISPFKAKVDLPKYPLIHKPEDYKPSWLVRREELKHRRVEQYEDLPE